MAEGSEELQVARDDGVVTVTINRPEVLNAMTGEMFADFGAICRGLNDDDSVRAVVVTGADGNFCAGAPRPAAPDGRQGARRGGRGRPEPGPRM